MSNIKIKSKEKEDEEYKQHKEDEEHNQEDNFSLNLKKEDWNLNNETLLKQWGEKAAGLRYMHNLSAKNWKQFSEYITISSIIITTLASGLTLISSNIKNNQSQVIIIYISSFISILSSFLQSFKKFYIAEEKAADHQLIAKQFGSLYRNLEMQLNISRENRQPVIILCKWALKEYERLQKEAPLIDTKIIDKFKNTFEKSKQTFPDIANSDYSIKIINSNQEHHNFSNKSNKEENEENIKNIEDKENTKNSENKENFILKKFNIVNQDINNKSIKIDEIIILDENI